MKTVSSHLQKHPHARPSTLRFIELRAAKTDQLRRELSEEQVREQLSMIGKLMKRLGWRPKADAADAARDRGM